MKRRKHSAAPARATVMAQLFGHAQQLHRQGRLDEAEARYREALALNPRAAGPMHFLGLLELQRGRVGQAEALMAGALQLTRDPVFLANYGLLKSQSGLHREAVELYREAVTRHPAYAEAWFNLGVSLAELGEHGPAIDAYRKAVGIRPGYARALANLVAVLQLTGDIDGADAASRELAALGTAGNEAGADLALALQRTGGHRDAGLAFRQLRASFAANPDDLETGLALARLLDESARYEESLAVYRSLARQAPGHVAAATGFAESLVRNGALAEAEAFVATLPAAVQSGSRVQVILGDIHRFHGRFAAAQACYEHALAVDPDCVGALHGLAQSRRFQPGDATLLSRIMDTAARKGSALLHFDAGKICDDLGRYEEAYAEFAEGNRLRRRGLEYDPASFTALVDAIIRVFDVLDEQRFVASASASCQPVFVLGAPRSGTSLVEQMLVSHPVVARGGELPYLPRLARRGAGAGRSDYPGRLAALEASQVASEAAQYLDETAPLLAAGSSRHVVDKLPTNFLYIGYIRLLFPDATVIHCRRNPVDTCLSMFFQSFNADYPWAFDLDWLAAWYRDYRRLMGYWDTRYPGLCEQVDYETVVRQPDATLRRLSARLRLDWHPDCDQFHLARGPVLSASHWQVRQPVYTRSVGRWRHYQAHIPQLLSLLEEAGAEA